MPLDRVIRTDLGEETIERLRSQITSGAWPVGTLIPAESELTARLGVGRGTLREAIRALAHAGLLEVRRGDGTYVRATSELAGPLQRLCADLGADRLLEVRQALETQAARLAAERATPEELDRLGELLTRRAEAWERRDRQAWVEADRAFHTEAVAAAHNPLLDLLYDELARPLRDAMNAQWDAEGFDGGDPTGHENLVAALRARDAEDAARQAATNVVDTITWIRARAAEH